MSLDRNELQRPHADNVSYRCSLIDRRAHLCDCDCVTRKPTCVRCVLCTLIGERPGNSRTGNFQDGAIARQIAAAASAAWFAHSLMLYGRDIIIVVVLVMVMWINCHCRLTAARPPTGQKLYTMIHPRGRYHCEFNISISL